MGFSNVNDRESDARRIRGAALGAVMSLRKLG
ncbi:MAG: hypothetical protein ACI9R3_004197 [Verrucomicrobiales bacterium]|jgi:hypothetical protein